MLLVCSRGKGTRTERRLIWTDEARAQRDDRFGKTDFDRRGARAERRPIWKDEARALRDYRFGQRRNWTDEARAHNDDRVGQSTRRARRENTGYRFGQNFWSALHQFNKSKEYHSKHGIQSEPRRYYQVGYCSSLRYRDHFL
jgi:hypothetical protein